MTFALFKLYINLKNHFPASQNEPRTSIKIILLKCISEMEFGNFLKMEVIKAYIRTTQG